MADEEDLTALLRGERDLYARDFRNADLASMALSDRDFGKCSFQKATLSRSDVSRSNFSKANLFMVIAQGAIFRDVVCENAIFLDCDFSQTDCSGAKFYRSHFTNANFDGAILSGADFTECVFGDGVSSFYGAIVDESTKFDRATGSRAQARQSAFRYYRFERGEFSRAEGESKLADTPQYSTALAAVMDTRKALSDVVRAGKPHVSDAAGIGHNIPPEPLNSDETAALGAVLDEVEQSLRTGDAARSTQLADTIANYAKRIGVWAVGKADIFAEEFTKGLGKEASTIKFWFGLWIILTGQLSHLANLIVDLIK